MRAIGVLFLVVASLVVPQRDPRRTVTAGPCTGDLDPLYQREKVLEKFAAVLNAEAPGFKKYEDRGFEVEGGRSKHFFVFDLVDPSNRSVPANSCVNFLNNHVYHFGAYYIPFSFSNIAILKDGKVKVFKSINCPESKDTLDEAVSYVKSTLKLDDKNLIIERLKNYRTHGDYYTIDDTHIRCRDLGK